MEPVVQASTSNITIPGYDILTPILKLIFGSAGVVSFLSFDSVFSFFGVLWFIFLILSYGVSFLFLYLYVYASSHAAKLGEIEAGRVAAQEEAFRMKMGIRPKQNRLAELQGHISSHNPNDWKLAIIEADILLDEILKKQGYAGTSLGERLRSISPSSLSTLDDAWQAHKVRNQIAHGGPDFVLTQQLAKQTIVQYERVFTELGGT